MKARREHGASKRKLPAETARGSGSFGAKRPSKAKRVPCGVFGAFGRKETRTIMNDDPVLVGYSGVPGAFGEQAAMECFPEGTLRPYAHFSDVFSAVQRGEVNYGVVPIENTAGGSIYEVYDRLGDTGCSIVGEHLVAVRHCLLARPGVKRADVREVCSHEQALRQCREFLRKEPWTQAVCSNTAEAARQTAASPRTDLAAIASRRAAQCYGLCVLEEDIQDRTDNVTRFVVIAAQPVALSGMGKVSLTFTLKHAVGALHTVLAIFASHGLNLCKIESRNIPGRSWEYRFYVDYEGELRQEAIERILAVLAAYTNEIRLLGCYRAWPENEPKGE